VKGYHNPHSFRHGFAKSYALAGGDLVTLSRIFGDDIKTIVAHYAIFTDSEVAAAHEKYSPIVQLQEKIERKEE
jgi:integrase/recombinase XerD